MAHPRSGRAVSTGPGRFDDHGSDTPLDAVAGAFGRRMLRPAALRYAVGAKEADARERELRAAFGDGARAGRGQGSDRS